jgi:hypothetical protein
MIQGLLRRDSVFGVNGEKLADELPALHGLGGKNFSEIEISCCNLANLVSVVLVVLNIAFKG